MVIIEVFFYKNNIKRYKWRKEKWKAVKEIFQMQSRTTQNKMCNKDFKVLRKHERFCHILMLQDKTVKLQLSVCTSNGTTIVTPVMKSTRANPVTDTLQKKKKVLMSVKN